MWHLYPLNTREDRDRPALNLSDGLYAVKDAAGFDQRDLSIRSPDASKSVCEVVADNVPYGEPFSKIELFDAGVALGPL